MMVPLSTRLGSRFDWRGQRAPARVGWLDRQGRVNGEHFVRTDEASEEHGHDVHLRGIFVEGAAFAVQLGGSQIEGPPRRAADGDTWRRLERGSLVETRPIGA